MIPGDKFAYKLSGEYFTAKDFQYVDPNEPTRYSTTDTRIPTERRGAVRGARFRSAPHVR